MKKDYPDAQRKKLVAELLKSADKLLKSGEFDQALAEVEKGLELEPGNFYAQAYKERIATLRERHGGPAATGKPSRPEPRPVDQAIPQAEIIPDEPGEVPPAEIITDEPEDAVAAESLPPAPDADIDDLREQHERERATQESETDKQAEEIARKALEQEITQGVAAEKMAVAEREATARAIEEGRARARTEIVSRLENSVAALLSSGDLEGAFAELSRLSIADPENERLQDLRLQIDAATAKTFTPATGDAETFSRETAGVVFGNILKAAWREGTPNEAQARVVDAARTHLGVSPEEEKTVMMKIQREVITEAMREAYRDGDPDPETKSFLDRLTTELAEGLRALR
jgi:tetratricopeptide (TPR) repeat protein